MRVTAGLEKRMFKPVAAGYVFQPRPPTPWRETSAYLVSEAQKAQILAVYRAGDETRGWWVIAAAIVLAVAISRWLQADGASALDIALAVVYVWLVAQMIGFALVGAWKLRELQPVLANLSESPERLFAAPGQVVGSEAPLSFWLVLLSVGCGFLLGLRVRQHPPFADAGSTALLICLVHSLFWVAVALRRRRCAQ